MKLLVTQSFGRESEYKRVVLAVLSFWALYTGNKEDVLTIIATDKPDYFFSYFEGLPIEYIILTPEKIKVMRGKINFIHRMKIALIEEAYSRYPGKDMLYIDSDTVFLKNPSDILEKIHGTNSFMHKVEFEYSEYRRFAVHGLGEEDHLPFINLLEDKTFMTSRGEEKFHSLIGWNAGVMGLPAKVASFLPDIYYLTDEFYTAAPLNGSEQAAFSYILQTRTNLQGCEDYVYHYWGVFKKEVIDFVLPKLLDEKFSKLNLAQRLKRTKKLIIQVPLTIKMHEEALHCLNTDKFSSGYKHAIKAMFMAPVYKPFFIHVLYHIKRQLLGEK